MNLPIRTLGDYWQLLQKHGLLSSAQPLSADLLSRPVALVSCDSQSVTPGTLFIVKGAHFKGRYLASRAMARRTSLTSRQGAAPASSHTWSER